MKLPVLVLAALVVGCASVPEQTRRAVIAIERPDLYTQAVAVRCRDGSAVAVTALHVAQALHLTVLAEQPQRDIAAVDVLTGPGLELGPRPERDDEVWLVHSPAGFRQAAGRGLVLADADANGDFAIVAWGWFGSSGGAVVDHRARLVGVVRGLQTLMSRVSPFPEIPPLLWAAGPDAIRAVVTAASPRCFARDVPPRHEETERP